MNLFSQWNVPSFILLLTALEILKMKTSLLKNNAHVRNRKHIIYFFQRLRTLTSKSFKWVVYPYVNDNFILLNEFI